MNDKQETLDRIADALERIADVMEGGSPIVAQDGGGNGNGPPDDGGDVGP